MKDRREKQNGETTDDKQRKKSIQNNNTTDTRGREEKLEVEKKECVVEWESEKRHYSRGKIKMRVKHGTESESRRQDM